MNNEVQHETYSVKGMTCAACAASLESHLKSQKGIREVSVNYADNSAFITFDPASIQLKNIQKAADEIGYQVIEPKAYDEQAEYTGRLNTLRKKLIGSAVLTLPVFVISMFLRNILPYENIILFIFSTPVIFWAGSEFFINAWKKARHRTMNMDTLVALSTGAAYVFSIFNTINPGYFLTRGLEPHVYYESATVIITLILLGRYFEERAKFRTTGAIKKLMGIQPRSVEILIDGTPISKPIAEVKKGDMFLVRPGGKIALDGYVTGGQSYVDESMITGEPVPVIKEAGDYIFAGTINQNGTLDVRAEKESGGTLLAQIIEMVKKAQASKPPIQKVVDRVAAYFVPIVILIALLSFLTWYFAGPEPRLTYSFLILITVLIIACPCALGLATPTALMVGIGRGAEMGILIKDAQSLETGFKINALVLDKTGTITLGRPEVLEVAWNEKYDRERELDRLLLLESKSEHPLARAILDHFHQPPGNWTDLTFENIPGKGVRGIIKGQKYLAGNRDLVMQGKTRMNDDLAGMERKLQNDGFSIVYFADDREVICIIGIRDPIRDGAGKAIQDIRSMGIEVTLLSGDNAFITERIARELGVDHFKGGVLPDQKGEYIQELRKQGKVVAMAGDGINDARALAEADIGIAMGTGTDIAMETAGITLIQSDIQHIRGAVDLSRATVKTIYQNLFWAFIYNVLAIPVAAGVLFPFTGFLLNPMIAGGAMAFSSVSVVMNSLRLKKKNIAGG